MLAKVYDRLGELVAAMGGAKKAPKPHARPTTAIQRHQHRMKLRERHERHERLMARIHASRERRKGG